jgi:drug/metabolite transporter (DMT)-like permease
LTNHPILWDSSGLWLLVINGVSTTFMTLLLYAGLARGPVSVVAPIVASYPALVLAIAVMLGFRATIFQWSAVGITIAGVITVAGAAAHSVNPSQGKRDLLGTLAISALSCLFYAALVAAGQAAVPIYGEIQTLWFGRLISLASILVFLLPSRHRRLEPAWWPVLIAQGLLDAGGYLMLFAGSIGQNAALAAVTGSTFGVVTTLLARFILKEQVKALQWTGILLVFSGVASLSLL